MPNLIYSDNSFMKNSYVFALDRDPTLGALVKAHQRFQDKTDLPENFGDGYLMSHNPIFLNVRKAAHRCGYRFDSQALDYVAFPFLRLRSILMSKSIPYVKNVRALEDAANTSLAGVSFSKLPHGFWHNHLLHESAHGIAYSRTADGRLGKRLRKYLSVPRTAVLIAMTDEAIANTAEALGMLYRDDPGHQIFYRINAYESYPQSKLALLRTVVKKYGLPTAARLTFYSFLLMNFLYRSIDSRNFSKILSLCSLVPERKRDFDILFRSFCTAFEHSAEFILPLQNAHFRLNGFAHPAKILAFDPIRVIEREEIYGTVLDEIIDDVLGSNRESTKLPASGMRLRHVA